MAQKIKTAMILAAGLGTRLRPLIDSIPKALVEVQGKPMLDWVISYIKDAGIQKIIINTHYLAGKIERHIADSYSETRIHIIYEPLLLGSGGGILNAMNIFGFEPMVVINSDAFFWGGNPILPLTRAWRDEMKCLVLGHDKDAVQKPEGDFNIDKNGYIMRDPICNQYIMVGCSIFAPSFFEGKEVGFFTTPDIFFSSSHKYHALPNPYSWIDIGTPQDLEKANQLTMKTISTHERS